MDVDYWPEGVAREETADAFIAAYGTLGYRPCDDGRPEPSFEKVAIYFQRGRPTHAAHQLPNGKWTSKLGRDVDVGHDTLEEIRDSYDYSDPAIFLKRRLSADSD